MDYKQVKQEADKNSSQFGQLMPEFLEAFQGAGEKLVNSDHLDGKTKELIFLAFAVAKQCDACIATHTENYIEAGGDRESLGELAAIAVLMQGGPGLTYAGKVIEAFDQLSE